MVMFSVVIPVYNVEQYLIQCLESVIGQDMDSIEIILVDDGSVDGSAQICMEYEGRYQFVKYIKQKNAGQGMARNVGLKQAQGRYVIFLDADDYWSSDCCTTIQKCLANYPCLDIVYFDADIIYDSTEIPRNDNYDQMAYQREGRIREDVCTGNAFFEDTYPRYINVSPCMAVFRRNFLLRERIDFPENIIYEDNVFFLQTILAAKFVKYVPKKLYVRRYRTNSTMTGKINHRNITSSAKVFEIVADYVEGKKGQYEEHVFRKMRDFAIALAFTCVQQCNACDKSQNNIQWIKENVYKKVYRLILEEKKNFSLDELRNYILLISYIKEDIKMECIAELILYETGKSSLEELLSFCKRQYNEIAEKKLKQLSFFNRDKKVGVYGRGNHTKQLFRILKRIGGLPKTLYVIDSNIAERDQSFEGFPVVNIRDVPKDTDTVLISSFLYEREMYQNAKWYLPEHIYIERMYQNEVWEICWEWMCNDE